MATAALVNGAHRGGYAVDRVMFPTPAFNETASHYDSVVHRQEEQPDLNDVVLALQEGEAPQRRWALELLGAAAAERPGLGLELMKFLRQSLEDDDLRVRKAAVQVFGQLGEHASEHTHEILDFLRDPDPELRVAAATALGDIGAWEHLEEIRPLLADSDAAVVRAALGAAQKWGENGQQLASSILECLRSSGRGVRCEAAKALASWAAVGERLAGHVAEILGDSDSAAREAAVAFFAAAGPRAARRAAVAAAVHLEGSTAAAAAVALGHMQATSYAAQVAGLLKSTGFRDVSLSLAAAGLEARPPVELRRQECGAARSLMLMGPAGAEHADAVAALLVDPQGPPEATASLIRSLAGMGDEAHRHKGKIQSFLEHPHASVREAACHGVGILAEAGAVGGEALLGRLGDSQGCVRRAAARACSHLQEPSLYVDAVAKLIEDPVPAVQAAALVAVASMGTDGRPYAATICRLAVADEKRPVNSAVRAAALSALAAMGDRGAAYAPEVATCFEAEEPEVRAAALLAMAEFREEGRNFLTDVELLRSDPKENVRAAADQCVMALSAN